MDEAVMNLENAMKLDPHEQGFHKNLQKMLEMKSAAHRDAAEDRTIDHALH